MTPGIFSMPKNIFWAKNGELLDRFQATQSDSQISQKNLKSNSLLSTLPGGIWTPIYRIMRAFASEIHFSKSGEYLMLQDSNVVVAANSQGQIKVRHSYRIFLCDINASLSSSEGHTNATCQETAIFVHRRLFPSIFRKITPISSVFSQF